MKAFAAEIASSPAADITIYRTLVDGDSVLLHSRYEGLKNAPGPLLAMDLFRFEDDKIAEHWGGQQPESPDRNLSGHTQVDGPTAVEDREKTEANRKLIQTYREIITVQQHYDRIGEFLADNYAQHAEGFGDGIERVKARYAKDVKPGTSHVLTPRFYVADGNFVLSVVDARTDPPKVNFDLFRIADGKLAEHGRCCHPFLRAINGRTQTGHSSQARGVSHLGTPWSTWSGQTVLTDSDGRPTPPEGRCRAAEKPYPAG
jgi:predicted SnoaL-like aldol condensation-catalyzing enzyme